MFVMQILKLFKQNQIIIPLLPGNMLVNLQMSVADKLGQQYSLGYVDTTTASVANESLDGRLCSSAGETFSLSAPLYSLLGNSEKLIPLFLLQNM